MYLRASDDTLSERITHDYENTEYALIFHWLSIFCRSPTMEIKVPEVWGEKYLFLAKYLNYNTLFCL